MCGCGGILTIPLRRLSLLTVPGATLQHLVASKIAPTGPLSSTAAMGVSVIVNTNKSCNNGTHILHWPG